MRTAIVFLWLLAFFSGNAFAQVVGGSALAHCFEAIYLYYGYLADIAINGDKRTLGRQCTPLTGTVCTVWEFIKSIETPFDAASLGDGGGIGDTTRPDDLLELAEAMYNNGFDRYNSETMFGEYVKHTLVLEKQDRLDGFEEMGRNLATDQYDPEKLQIHVKIAQSIRTQSDALSSLATCKALG